jgi:hypothetical protein
LEPKHEYPQIYTENELGIECGLAEIEVTLGGDDGFILLYIH